MAGIAAQAASSTHRARSRPESLDAAALGSVGAAALALTLGLFHLAIPSLWVDEALTVRAVGWPYSRLVSQDHWLYYTVMKPWAALAGTSEWALRFPSVIATAAACALLVQLGARLFGPRQGALAGALLAVSPFVVVWSQQARSYAFLMLLAVAASSLLVRALEQPSRSRWTMYAAAMLILIIGQALSGLLLVLAQAAAVGRRRDFRATAGIVLGVALAWVAAVAIRESGGGPTRWLHRPTPLQVIGTLLEIAGPLGIGLAAAAAGILLLRCHERWRLLTCWALVPFFLSLAASTLTPVFLDRYLIVSAPAFALLAAAGIARLPRPPIRALAGAAMAAAAAAGLAVWYSHGAADLRGNDWRAATAFVMTHGGGSVSPYWATPVFRYYGGKPTRGHWTLERTEQAQRGGVPFGPYLHAVPRDP